MADTAIEVKKTAPATALAPVPAPGAPDLWSSLRNEMERVFDRFSGAFAMPSLRRMFDFTPAHRIESTFTFTAPAIDVTENGKAYKVTAELPGMEPANVEVTVSGDALVIKGEKRQEKEEKDENYYMSERSFGSFQRSFPLPPGVDRDKIGAELSKGVLTVTMPKTAEAQKQQKKIEVKAA
ncbi:MAG TPA: Hsp20/alpha crystallin family protein [Stellaceae bacterium]|nr:Hsp20/alpha crystallin family protein [Stellaceae bacterium]